MSVTAAFMENSPAPDRGERDLTREAINGDDRAYTALFLKYQHNLQEMCKHKLGLSDTEAEDVVQEAAIKGYRAINRFEERSSFYSWIWRIAYNTGQVKLRDRTREFASLDEEEGRSVYINQKYVSTDDDPLTILMKEEERDQSALLFECMSQLPEHYRTVAERKIAGKSEEDIAAELDILPGTVKSRYYRVSKEILPEAFANNRAGKMPVQGSLFGLSLQYVFKNDEERKQLLDIWREERRMPPLSEEEVIASLKEINPAIGTKEYSGNRYLRKEAQQAIARLDLCLLFGWRGLPGGQSVDFLLYKHGLTDAKPDLSESFIAVNMLKYFLKYGELPLCARGAKVEDLKDEKWEKWRDNLQSGCRGLDGGLCWESFKVKYKFRFEEFTEETIIRHTLSRFKKYGELIKSNSTEPLHDAIGEDGRSINQALQKGNRSKTIDVKSLHELYVKHDLKIGKLSKEKVLDLILEYVKLHREIPTRKHKEVPGYIAESWSAIESALGLKQRGITEKSSVYQIFRNFVINEARIHYALTGEKPSRASGPLKGRPDIDWKLVEDGLMNYKGGRSCDLVKFLSDTEFQRLPAAEKPATPFVVPPLPAAMPVPPHSAMPPTPGEAILLKHWLRKDDRNFLQSLRQNFILSLTWPDAAWEEDGPEPAY